MEMRLHNNGFYNWLTQTIQKFDPM